MKDWNSKKEIWQYAQTLGLKQKQLEVVSGKRIADMNKQQLADAVRKLEQLPAKHFMLKEPELKKMLVDYRRKTVGQLRNDLKHWQKQRASAHSPEEYVVTNDKVNIIETAIEEKKAVIQHHRKARETRSTSFWDKEKMAYYEVDYNDPFTILLTKIVDRNLKDRGKTGIRPSKLADVALDIVEENETDMNFALQNINAKRDFLSLHPEVNPQAIPEHPLKKYDQKKFIAIADKMVAALNKEGYNVKAKEKQEIRDTFRRWAGLRELGRSTSTEIGRF
jgi:hypothetical protein